MVFGEGLSPLLSPASEGEAGGQSIPASGEGRLRGEAVNKHGHFRAAIVPFAMGAIRRSCISQMTGDFMGHRGPVRIKSVDELAILPVNVRIDNARRIALARCGCGCGFHHGEEIKAGQWKAQGFFSIVFYLIKRLFERGVQYERSIKNERSPLLERGRGDIPRKIKRPFYS